METASVPAEKARQVGVTGVRDELARRLSQLVLPATLSGLTIYFGFEAGGYFADTTGWATAGMAIALAIAALAFGRRPSTLGWPLAAAGGALAVLAIFTLASSAWSDATARALVE